MSSDDQTRPRPEQLSAQRRRDAAFARISRARGAVILGAGGLSAAVAAVVSAAAPGHTLAKTPAATGATPPRASARPKTTTQLPPLARPGQLGLQGPSSAPQSGGQSSPQTSPQTQTQTQTQTQAPTPAPAAPASSTPAAVSGGS
jgi:hypothetical protein